MNAQPNFPSATLLNPALHPAYGMPMDTRRVLRTDEDEGLGRKEIPLSELGICRLRTAGEIRSVLHLRDHIDLKAAALADPHFMTREKKETN